MVKLFIFVKSGGYGLLIDDDSLRVLLKRATLEGTSKNIKLVLEEAGNILSKLPRKQVMIFTALKGVKDEAQNVLKGINFKIMNAIRSPKDTRAIKFLKQKVNKEILVRSNGKAVSEKIKIFVAYYRNSFSCLIRDGDKEIIFDRVVKDLDGSEEKALYARSLNEIFDLFELGNRDKPIKIYSVVKLSKELNSRYNSVKYIQVSNYQAFPELLYLRKTAEKASLRWR